MSEWWTYSLHDFLLFSPRTYYRLIERYNAETWPAQVVGALGSVVVLVASTRRFASSARTAAIVLALAWAWVAYGFLWGRYATINWAATYVAGAFAVEAGLLVASVVVRVNARDGDSLSATPAFGVGAAVGWLLLVVAVLYPAMAPITGRGARTAEVFGLMPDPTVLATLGVLLVRPFPLRGWLLPIPLAWCAVSGATLWAMRSPEALLLPIAGAAVLVAVAIGARAAYLGPLR